MRYSVNCSIMLQHLPLHQRPRVVADAGFGAVEFWWPFDTAAPCDEDVSDFERAVSDSGCRLTALNLYSGDRSAGDQGIIGDPRGRDGFQASLDVAIGIAERTGCRAFNVLYGNLEPGVTIEQHDALALENLVAAANALARIGASVLLEPRSASPRYGLRSVTKALAIIEAARAHGADNVLLLADFYHLAVTGHDVSAVIRDHLDIIGHIQIADAPGRGAPGTGDLPLRSWLELCAQGGYDGAIALEYEAVDDDLFGWLPRMQRAWQGD